MQQLPAEHARSLLRKLRDLDWKAGYVDVTDDLRVRVGGCLSLDAPIESSLRYRVHVDGRDESILDIAWNAGVLELLLLQDDGAAGPGPGPSRSFPLLADGEGKAAAPAIGASMDPESTSEVEVEHFLRRLVQAAFSS